MGEVLQQTYRDFWRKISESCFELGRLWREEDGDLGSTFLLPWRWENTTFDQNIDFMKQNSEIT